MLCTGTSACQFPSAVTLADFTVRKNVTLLKYRTLYSLESDQHVSIYITRDCEGAFSLLWTA